jgi:phasin family protein
MVNAFDDMQKISQSNADAAISAWGTWSQNWQALAAGLGEYQKRTMEDSAATLQKLMGAKSLDQAFEIQTSFARRSYEQYLQEMSRVGTFYAGMAKEAMQPIVRMAEGGRPR